MKKTIQILALVCFIFGAAACGSDSLDDVTIDVQDQKATDPDEPQPGCDSPNGCVAKI